MLVELDQVVFGNVGEVVLEFQIGLVVAAFQIEEVQRVVGAIREGARVGL